MINIFIALALLIGGSLSYSAENTLPGDMLYIVKTEVNERVRGWFAISDAAESKLEADLALRRLEEARDLAAQNRLDAETKAELSAEFRAHAKEADKEIDKLETSGKKEEAAEIRANLNARVRAEGGVFNIMNIESEINAELEGETRISEKKRIDVKTEQGMLTLTYEDRTLTLSGRLMRANPCVDWNIETYITRTDPSIVTFTITQKSTADICIQVLGEPQEINVKTSLPLGSIVNISLEGKAVFSGKMN